MRLIYFAQVREMIGQNVEEIDLPAHVETMLDLIELLAARGGGYRNAMAMDDLCMAIDQEFADRDSALAGAYEVAFFPPMTGG